jgi:hypothetical protein
MRKNTRKLKGTKKKNINNTIKKEGRGFDSPRVAPRERSDTKEAEKMRKNIRKLKSTKKKTINNIVTKKDEGG